MSDPFRNELESAMARIRELEGRLAELQQENARLRAGHAPPRSRLPWLLPLVIVGAVGVAIVMLLAGAFMFFRVEKAPAPVPAVTGPWDDAGSGRTE